MIDLWKKPVTLEEQMAEKLSAELRHDIDFEVLSNMLIELGWHRRFVNYQPPERSWILVKDWADKNCKGHHQEHRGIWLFENAQDANWFTLRWE